jgi:FAD:protein FMN transferase
LKNHGQVFLFLALLGIAAAVRAEAAPQLLTWEGRTMGTTYMVKIVGVASADALVAELRAAVEARFEEINRQMSNYRPDSELSRFNASPSLEPFPVSPEFARVVRQALELSRDSGGAFDPTVGPLVDLWGFGASGRRAHLPSEAEIAETRQNCGAGHLQVTPQDELQKDIPGLRLDLGGIAKGYGADVAAQVLRARGYSNVFVSVCGEIVAFGHNPDGKPWQVGVERPIQDLPRGADHIAVVPLSGRALSTSGDTYNYFQDAEGTTYSHILDPSTGRPIQHQLASVTVMGPNGLTADGLATTLYVMGLERGLEWIEARPGYAALFIARTGTDGFQLVPSSRFPPGPPAP